MKIVIKIGGALIAKNFENVIQDITEILQQHKNKYKIIIVHGGGPQINDILHRMNKEPHYFKTPSGFTTRYTDHEAIEAAIMSLAGINNKRIVEAFQKKHVNAFGFTGIDGGVIEAERKDKILVLINGKRIIKRGEFSGKVKKVNSEVIDYLTEKGYLPVIACLGKSEQGVIVNVDGDRAASYVAKALDADLLISLTDVEGIYKDFENKDTIIKKILTSQLEDVINSLKGGMKKKAYAALEAIKVGLKKVVISSGLVEKPVFDVLENDAGTVITDE
ncbi:MAG: [LysW]-aminoadipate kinase [Candidatus Lokiarchaeota archaeon]|nr:[LysW]-aminoadipate kinase [Candidatus Lokiarchaeota archaeon]MBD3342701.1 [LysW]-aminoadipate kinase [Candidatus Lokiarchaeota archaeon]